MGVSDKYKKHNKDINRKNLEKLSKFDWFKKLFEIKFLDLFNLYYNDEQPLEELSFLDKTIILSENTKSFYWLLKNYQELKVDIIKVVKKSYFNNQNTI